MLQPGQVLVSIPSRDLSQLQLFLTIFRLIRSVPRVSIPSRDLSQLQRKWLARWRCGDDVVSIPSRDLSQLQRICC